MHDAIDMRHNNWAQRRWQGWFDKARDKHKSSSAIYSTEDGGTLISEPKLLATSVQEFFEDWAGILQGALFVIQVCNLHQKYSILDNGDFSGPGK